MKIKTSSLEDYIYLPYYAIDGNPRTRWSSAFKDNQWLMIDYEDFEKISSIRIDWDDAIAKEYEVLLSTDGNNWKTVFNKTTDMPDHYTHEIEVFPAIKTRYIKINLKKRATKFGFSIKEIMVNDDFMHPGRRSKHSFKKFPSNKSYSNKKLSPNERAKLLLKEMSLDEKGEMVSGFCEFYLPGNKRLGMRPFYMADSGMGIRLLNNTPTGLKKTTAFPCLMILASSWNPELSYEYAKALGEECNAGDVSVLLGPGMNIYRMSTCGRNFEYTGEDPCLASRLVEGYVKGLQSCGVMATLKHFVANNTEFHRRQSISIIKERELHEIYMPAFKAGIDAGAAAVMTAYNLVNGEWASQSKYVITDLLRGELGFKGLVMTDWVAVHDQVKTINSGLDLVMPAAQNMEENVKMGKVAEKALDRMIINILTACFKMGWYDKDFHDKSLTKKFPEHEKIALKTNHEGIVLLRNENNFLPIRKKNINSILLIGKAAEKITYGGGASVVKGYNNITLLGAMKKEFGDKLIYKKKATDKEMKSADAVIIALSSFHKESIDTDFDSKPENSKLAVKVAKLNPNNAVVTMFGSGQRMTDWSDKVTSILYAWFGGQSQGKAIVDILVGRVNPSGKLPITIEKEFADCPCPDYKPKKAPEWDIFGKYKHTYKLKYQEGIFVGYRWYDTKNIEPLYPFGFGLTYTKFTYSDLKLSSDKIGKRKEITVSFNLKNNGKRIGAEIAQLYVHDVESSIERPVKELKGFKKVFLKPGETKKVELKLNWKDMAFWNPKTKGWTAEAGKFKIMIGASSREIKLEGEIKVSRTS